MATRRYKISVGEGFGSVTEEAGAAVNSDAVELTVELATTTVGTASSTRGITQAEVLDCIEKIRVHILEGNWPPA